MPINHRHIPEWHDQYFIDIFNRLSSNQGRHGAAGKQKQPRHGQNHDAFEMVFTLQHNRLLYSETWKEKTHRLQWTTGFPCWNERP